MDKNKKLFPQRLWELIHDEKYNFCLRWSPDGQRVYLNRNEFETHYLRTANNQFHTQKAISFVRQMNMYGFRKVDDCYYENDNFKRDCQHLLKNMARRHASKAMMSPIIDSLEHQNHSHNQQQQQQQRHNKGTNDRQQHFNRHLHRAQSDYLAVYKPSQSTATGNSINLDIDRQSGQYFRDGSSAIGNIGAAMAAIDTSSASSLPLASSLYHRLTALNFGQSDTNCETIVQQQSRQQQFIPPNVLAPISTPTVETTQVRDSNLTQSQRATWANQPQLDVTAPSMDTQAPLITRQLLQQTLVRSLLQLKQQPQSPRSVKQNLLSTIQQQYPNLLLESLANWSSITPNIQPNQPIVSPYESVANSATRFTSGLNNQSQQFQMDNTLLLNLLAEHSSMTGLNGDPTLDNIDDEDELEGDDGCVVDFEGDLFSRNCSLTVNSSSSSSNQEILRDQHDYDDDDNVVLNLAKPSNKRSDGRQRL